MTVSLFIKILIVSVLNSQQFPKEKTARKVVREQKIICGKVVWEVSGGSWQLKIHIEPLGDTLRVERYDTNLTNTHCAADVDGAGGAAARRRW